LFLTASPTLSTRPPFSSLSLSLMAYALHGADQPLRKRNTYIEQETCAAAKPAWWLGLNPTCPPMTNQRPLCGGFADVPVDPTKRTLDGDDSGDLYSFLEGALAKEGGVPTPVVILQAARQVVAGLYVRTSPLRPFAPLHVPKTLSLALAPSRARRSSETGSSSSKRTTLRATRPLSTSTCPATAAGSS